jgi:hypothetical protein
MDEGKDGVDDALVLLAGDAGAANSAPMALYSFFFTLSTFFWDPDPATETRVRCF